MTERHCYFAHHVTDYDTERERSAVERIEAGGFTVVNPNSPEDDVAYRERGMQHFVERVQACDAVAFQRFPEGQIGAGVAKEIQSAAADGKPVYEVTDDAFTRVDPESINPDILSVDATRALLRAIRETKRP